MADNATAALLTEAHRIAQVDIAAMTVDQLNAIWPILDPARIDATVDEWLQVALAIIRQQRQGSAELAVEYLAIFRQLEYGTADGFTPTTSELVDMDAIVTSMKVTGPYRLKTLTSAGASLFEASSTAQMTSSAAGLRHALNGGRQTIFDNGRRDPAVIGYSRAVSGQPCAFCAMLAGRGPVYYTAETADFQPHDGCSCYPEPAYSTDQAWATGARDFESLYRESTTGYSGDNAIRAFRRAYESQQGRYPVAPIGPTV